MKKTFNFYAILWAVLLVLFNVIAFVSVGWAGQEKYTASFWIGYIFISLSFVGNLICARQAFKADTLQKLFYGISVAYASYVGLVLSFVFGGLCMLISPLPYWVGVILCAIVLTVQILSVLKAQAAVELVTKTDAKIKTQTFFIKSLTIDADTLMAQAKSEAVKAECRKVYEAVRYSDPMSNAALATVEGQITVKFAELSEAVKTDDIEKTVELAKEVLILVGDRNKKCKLLK
jgi:hypothetical protein